MALRTLRDQPFHPSTCSLVGLLKARGQSGMRIRCCATHVSDLMRQGVDGYSDIKVGTPQATFSPQHSRTHQHTIPALVICRDQKCSTNSDRKAHSPDMSR